MDGRDFTEKERELIYGIKGALIIDDGWGEIASLEIEDGRTCLIRYLPLQKAEDNYAIVQQIAPLGDKAAYEKILKNLI